MGELTQKEYYSRINLTDTQHIVFFVIENHGTYNEIVGKEVGDSDFFGSYNLEKIKNELKALRARETRYKNQDPEYEKNYYQIDFLVVNDLKKEDGVKKEILNSFNVAR